MHQQHILQAVYVVKLESKTEKSDNWEDYKDKLKEIILAEKQADSTFVSNVIKTALPRRECESKRLSIPKLVVTIHHN